MKHDIDIIIVSSAKSKVLHDMTLHTIQSCRDSEPLMSLNFIVIEQMPDVTYPGCLTLHYDGRFNYNNCLNRGIRSGTAPLIACCNNDLNFHPGWLSTILPGFLSYDSISPYCSYFNREHGIGISLGICPHCHKVNSQRWPDNGYIEGNRIAHEFNGWCFVLKREVWHTIGEFDTSYDFFMSDDMVLMQYKQHSIRHAICKDSHVDHVQRGNNTLRTMPIEWKQQQMNLLIEYKKYSHGTNYQTKG